MPIIDQNVDRYEVRVYKPTENRRTWRVNVTDLETGAQGRAFFASERIASAAVDLIGDPVVMDLFALA